VTRALLLILAAAVVSAVPVPARACSIAGPEPLVLDPSLQATDRQPPALTAISLVSVKRGQGSEASGCGGRGSSCDDLGSLGITVSATDDATAPADLGYRMTVASGKLPAGLSIPDFAMKAVGGPGELYLFWTDGATDDQESFDFTLTVVAVDRAGNASAPATLHIVDGDSGCNVAAAARRSGASALVAALMLLAVGLRRRRPHHEA
jgi:MYXO-CTERM domain-containing protein